MPTVDRQRRRVVIGRILILGMMALAALIFGLNRLFEALRDTYLIVAVFHEAPRLHVGSMVRLAGYPAGSVVRIELLPPGTLEETPPFAATLRIDTRHRELIRRDSELRLVRQRLMSAPIVELYPGTTESPILRPGDTLRAPPPIRPRSLIATARTVRASFDTLIAEGKSLRAEFEVMAEFRATAWEALEDLAAEFGVLERGLADGPLGEFLAEPGWRQSLQRIEAEATAIAELARERVGVVRGPELGAALEEFARRADETARRVAELRELLDAPLGFPKRWEEDNAIREAAAAARAHLDSLIEVTRRRPWRYFF